MSDMNEILQAENVSEVFGGLKAVSDFNLRLERGELVGLIGPNGAGKTTVFNMLTGVYQPTSGNISFEGESIVGLKPTRSPSAVLRVRSRISGCSPNSRCWRMSRLPFTITSSMACSNPCCASAVISRKRKPSRKRAASCSRSSTWRIKRMKWRRISRMAHSAVSRLPEPCGQAQAPAARRAGCRHESAGDKGTHGYDPLDPS